MLRAEIQAHVKIAQTYPSFLEPNLYVARYFLEICEEGEGIKPSDRDNAAVLDQMNLLDENALSTEVELVADNDSAIAVLLRIVETYRDMAPAPEFDTKKRLFARLRRPDPFPDLYEPVAEYDIPRNQTSLLRMALRCLRMITVIKDARDYIYAHATSISMLNRVVDENALDAFIRQDVKSIFKNLYAGDESVKRMESASISVTVELMNDYDESPIVQLAGIKRLDIHVRVVRDDEDFARCIDEILTTDAIAAVGRALARFPATYSDIYVHACRLMVAFVSPARLEADEEAGRPHDERVSKLIGQHGGVEAAIRLLKRCRGFHTQHASMKDDPEPVAVPPPVASTVVAKRLTEQEELDALKLQMMASPPEDPNPDEMLVKAEKAKATDWKTPDLAQQALWALDVLSISDFNRIAMKREKLKYVVSEVSLGSQLIVPRRLRLLDWASIGHEPDKEGDAMDPID
ncbi:hypothetical protein SPRG_18854 [Saprolegnia parasitica CBS 223.65]|uniref:Uncharacterized protein n=1 Tax=Saprolegnia parasitica (strain CBS 223.65) TaxID=695850 RepID=A0A067D2K1_SAPPC|nr:hypothetical protein SPRG_18854 [Saprolegnia parasitica CBS 223.65]KDO35700.1 hypothetical protein SPRG_18854 [Saprolegnia parasitica CBS 223.65]|eukprot:XP_012194070.1 hypothetical protein SPRG_18854 [Saprolegnia parasitica CBS 223.65]